LPQIPINEIQNSPIKGLYEVIVGNDQRVFITSGADYFVAGELYQLTPEGLVNLTLAQRGSLGRAERIAAINPADKITFSPDKPKASITVFTDVDCGYCRKLHREMGSYLAAGIEVSYLAYPRAGIDSDSYHKMVSVWCADDSKDAMTRLKSGQSVASGDCENPVAEQYQLGVDFAVRGTPAIILESGELVSGYYPAAELAQKLGL
jgi:thiol:disulfide interchange protein DsbC